MEFVTFAQYWEMSAEEKQQIKQNLNDLQLDYLEPHSAWDVDSMKDQYIPIGVQDWRSMDKTNRKLYYENIEPEARANMVGHGSIDNPAYCDMEGHCYSYEEDAECADLYIKQLRLNREEYEIMKQSCEEQKKELDELSDKCIQEIEEKQKLRKEIKELKEENEKLKEENEKIGDLVVSQTDKLKEVSIKYNEGYKVNQEIKKNAWDPNKVFMDLYENTNYNPNEHGEFINYIQLLEKENKKLKEFCKRGRVAEKNSELEQMYLREAGLMFNDQNELVVKD